MKIHDSSNHKINENGPKPSCDYSKSDLIHNNKNV